MQLTTDLRRSNGASSAVFVLLALASIAGCSEPLVTETQVGGIPQTTLIIKGDLGPQRQNLELRLGLARITDAIVTVNGFPVPHVGGGIYNGDLPQAIPEGGTLSLKVVAGKKTFEGTGVVIPTPTITAPTPGSVFALTDSITLAWSTPVDPDGFRVCLNCWENSWYEGTYSVSGSARAFKIDALDLIPDGTPVSVSASKDNFLKSAGSPDILSQVAFVTTSRDVIITVKQWAPLAHE